MTRSEPDLWETACKWDWDRTPKMLDVLTIRSEAAKRAAAEDSSEYDNLMRAADAKAKMTMQVRAAAAKQAYEAECNSTREWLARQASSINVASEALGSGLLPSGDQKVVPLKRPARITSAPQPSYVSLPWSDAITESMECIDRIARTLEEENGGKRSKRHEKLLLQKYFEALGSPQTGGIGRSGYPEHVEKRVNRYLWLEQAFDAGKAIYLKGYPVPFTQEEQQALQNKMRVAGVPKDGSQQLIGSLRKFVKRNSKRPRTH
jgi:hypothetical protein